MVDPGLHRTIMGDGLGTIASALLGGPANTTYGENTAVLAITKNYNPRNLFIAACMAVVLGLFVPFGEFLGGIPVAVVGGACVVLFGMISANGLRALVDAKVDFGNTKNLVVVSVTLAVGLGLGAMELVSSATGLNELSVGFTVSGGGFVKISALAIATIIAILLNLVLPNTKETAPEGDTEVSLSSAQGIALQDAQDITEETSTEE
jgi:uracil permease